MLFQEVGREGVVGGATEDDPVTAARAFDPASLDLVVVAPERVEWPGSGVVLSVEHLLLLRAALAEAGLAPPSRERRTASTH